jgi:glycosyltransferase involved in cell wall biosynthesis
MLAAHPPGRGSGSGLRGRVTLDALRGIFDRVDVVSFASAGEAEFADAEVHLVQRPDSPGALARILALRYGGGYYWYEREAGFEARIAGLARDGELLPRYDLVWACQSLTAAAGASIPARARVLDIDNIAGAEKRQSAADGSVAPGLRSARRLYAAVLGREERRRCALYDLVTVTSELERNRLGAIATPVAIVPNTIGAAPRVDAHRTEPELLFVGSLDYAPNVDAVRVLANDVMPRVRTRRAGTRLTVAGRNPTAEVRALCAEHGFELATDAPSLDPFYLRARAVVAPLRLGGGTRFKLLEAMAYGSAIVATPMAAEGIEIEHGSEALLASDPVAFADHCCTVLDDADHAARLGVAAHAAWERRYRPEAAAQIIGERVATLLGRS